MWGYVQRAHKAFGRNLLLANTLSSGGLMAVGDFLEQKREGGQFNASRNVRMLTVGLLAGPPHHYFYTILDKFLPGRSGRTIMKKVLLDQIIAAPFFALLFIYGADLLEGRSLSHCWAEFKDKFPQIYLFDWIIWPPTQFINFRYVPEQYRVLYVNGITVIWDIFLSYIKHREVLIVKRTDSHGEEGEGGTEENASSSSASGDKDK